MSERIRRFKAERLLYRLLAEYGSIHDCVEAGCETVRQRRIDVFPKEKMDLLRKLWKQLRGGEFPG